MRGTYSDELLTLTHLEQGDRHIYVRSAVTGILAVLALGIAGGAQAADPAYNNWNGQRQPAAPIPSSTSPGVAGGGQVAPVGPGSPSRLGKVCVKRLGIRICRFYRYGRIVKVCRFNIREQVRTCRIYRGGRVVRVCVWRPGQRERCRNITNRPVLKIGEVGPGPLISYRRLNSGFTNPLMPPVVRFYRNDNGWCSGTLLLRGIVLTAAHCLFANRTDGRGLYGYYPPASMVVVPGNRVDSTGRGAAPYGVWQVVDAYVPEGWKQEDGGLDWGIAVIGASASGYYPGDYTGTYTARWNAQFPLGSRIYKVGYPYSGPFATAAWYYGHGQYFCDNIWDGENGNNSFPYTASSYNLITTPCEMNGGSSGGPVFALLPNGTWTIVGVNDRGVDRSDGYGAYGISMYFDDRFGTFWNSVIAALNAKIPAGTHAREIGHSPYSAVAWSNTPQAAGDPKAPRYSPGMGAEAP
jgi:hypothetical protein